MDGSTNEAHMKEDIAYLGELLQIKKQVSLTNMNENSHSDFHGFISEEIFFKSLSHKIIHPLQNFLSDFL